MPRSKQPNPCVWAGQSLVEFALILPVLLLLVFGTIEFGRLLAIYSLTSNAAREATRYGAAVGDNQSATPYYLDCAGIRAAAKRSTVALLALTNSNVQIAYDHGTISGVFTTCDASPASSAIASGDRLVVTVTQTYNPIVPLVPIPSLPMTFVSARTIVKSISGPPECNDGIDNDSDGDIDYPADSQCASASDNTESAPAACRTLSTGISPGGSGSVSVAPAQNCSGGYTDGTIVTLTASPGTNYEFSSWSGDVGGSLNPTTLAMNANKSVTANFAPDCTPPPAIYSLTTTANPAGGGSVSPDVTPQCPGGYWSGTVVTLTANPNSGYSFVSWSGDASGSANPTAVTMDANKSVTANFCGVTAGGISKTGQEIIVDLTNNTGGIVTIDTVTITWPAGNGTLDRVQVNNSTVWSGSRPAPTTTLGSADWTGAASLRQIVNTGTKSLEFDFAANASGTASTGYTITVTFSPSTGCSTGLTVSN